MHSALRLLRKLSPFRFLCFVVLASTSLLGLGLSGTAYAQEVSEEALERAREYYIEGMDLYEKKLYSSAIENFKSANELSPHPANLFNIARSYEKLGDGENCVISYNEYISYFQEVNNGKSPPDMGDVRASLAKCELLSRPEVEIDSDPPGASIYLNDTEELLGQTPMTLKLDPGSYKLYLNLDGHAPFQETINVSPGRKVNLRFKLEEQKRVGKVYVTANIRKANIYVDGRNVGLTPYDEPIVLGEGTHQISIQKDEYHSFNQNIEVEAEKEHKVHGDIYLRDSPTTWKAYVGWVSIVLGAGMGVAGYFAGEEANKKFSDTDDFETWALYQKLGYGVGGGLLGAGLALVIWEAADNSFIKPGDALNTAETDKPLWTITPLVSFDGTMGATVQF